MASMLPQPGELRNDAGRCARQTFAKFRRASAELFPRSGLTTLRSVLRGERLDGRRSSEGTPPRRRGECSAFAEFPVESASATCYKLRVRTGAWTIRVSSGAGRERSKGRRMSRKLALVLAVAMVAAAQPMHATAQRISYAESSSKDKLES